MAEYAKANRISIQRISQIKALESSDFFKCVIYLSSRNESQWILRFRPLPIPAEIHARTACQGQGCDRAAPLPIRTFSSLPAIFPDALAPVVRNADGERELVMMRWGMPCPPQFGAAPVTDIRNTASPHWRRWLGPASRCLVPVTSFCEYEDTKPRKTPTWFALDDSRPLFCFAGIWTPWTGTRGTKAAPVVGDHLLYAFLTTEPNAEVRPIHPKAMPVILRTEAEMDAWMNAPWPAAAGLQRHLLDGALAIVARGEKIDGQLK